MNPSVEIDGLRLVIVDDVRLLYIVAAGALVRHQCIFIYRGPIAITLYFFRKIFFIVPVITTTVLDDDNSSIHFLRQLKCIHSDIRTKHTNKQTNTQTIINTISVFLK
jgi:hypothetical protein